MARRNQHPDAHRFAEHSDVTRAYQDLFEGVSEAVTATVRMGMADAILEGYVPSREDVVEEINLYRAPQR